MNSILKEVIGKLCHVFIDDIIIYAKSFNELLRNMDTVFGLIKNAGMTINSKKCTLFAEEVVLLGHQVSANGIAPDEEKIKIIKEWPIPKCKKELRAFLGTASYYRRFVHNFSMIASPLSQMTSSKIDSIWNNLKQLAFDKLRGNVKLSCAKTFQLQ
jgi:hypothetical protein